MVWLSARLSKACVSSSLVALVLVYKHLCAIVLNDPDNIGADRRGRFSEGRVRLHAVLAVPLCSKRSVEYWHGRL
jgi:hypothetical protein